MATGRDMRARLILSLQDRASPGLDRIPGRLDRIGSALRRIAAAAAIVGGLSMLGPMQQAAAFEDTLRQNAITAGETGAAVEAMIQRTRAAYERLARETGQRSRDIAAAAGSLNAAGLDDTAIQALLPTIARVATGTGASLEDLSQTAFQLRQQLGITIEQMPQAFASMVQAGRDGNFELRDMAREFPSILAAARALGMQGPNALTSLAAALQVARQAAGTSSEAANNVLNALQKLASPETVRNFAEIGVNLEGVMRDAARRGINPLEALVQKLRERTGGDLFRLQELFGDRQALMGLLPLIQETQRYLDIRNNARGASTGLIDQAFADRMRGALMQLTRTSELLGQIYRRFLLIAGTALGPINDQLDRLFAWMGRIETAYPGLIDNTMAWAAGLLGAAAAIGAIGQVVSFLGAGLSVMLAPLRLVFLAIAAVAGVKFAVIAAVVGAIAAAGYLIWRYWGDLAGLFDGIGAAWNRFITSEQVQWLRDALGGAAVWIGEKWEQLKEVFNGFSGFLARVFAPEIEAIQTLIGWIRQALDWLARLPRLATPETFSPEAQAQRGQRMNAMGAQAISPEEWNAPDAVPPRGAARVAGEIVVRPAPGAEVVDARTTTGAVAITPDRGATRSRP